MIADLLDRLWDGLTPDPGPVDPLTVTRRPSGNDARLAPAGSGPADLEAPVYPILPERLAAILEQVILAEPGAERLPSPPERPRYRVRSRAFRFPDMVDAVVIPRGEGASTLALYSRSLVGSKDFGVNLARLRRWLAAIGREAGP